MEELRDDEVTGALVCHDCGESRWKIGTAFDPYLPVAFECTGCKTLIRLRVDGKIHAVMARELN